MPWKPDLSRVPTSELIRELERRQAMAGEFEARREALERELDDIDAELSALDATSRNGVRPRHVNRSASARARSANQEPLHVALQRLLTGRKLSVSEAADAVQKAGYKTHAANFRTIVNMTLIKHKALFRKKGRGKYTAK